MIQKRIFVCAGSPSSLYFKAVKGAHIGSALLPFEDKVTKHQLQNCVNGKRIGVIGTFSSQQNLNLRKQIAK